MCKPCLGCAQTSLLNQVIVHTLNQPDGELVPILIKVQELQSSLLQAPGLFAKTWNWVDAFLQLKHSAATYRMLRQAMASRRALFLLDGLDEGGERREQIERHVLEVLAPQGCAHVHCGRSHTHLAICFIAITS